MNKINLDQRKLILQEKLNKMKHSDILPKYPADKTPLVRQKRKVIVKKIVFDTK